jgi:hypothetical protein
MASEVSDWGSKISGGFRGPRTILGFVVATITVCGLLLYKVLDILTKSVAGQAYIGSALVAGAILVFGLLLFVILLAIFDAEKLMLGEIHADAWVKLRQLKLKQGDSASGDKKVPLFGRKPARLKKASDSETTVQASAGADNE